MSANAPRASPGGAFGGPHPDDDRALSLRLGQRLAGQPRRAEPGQTVEDILEHPADRVSAIRPRSSRRPTTGHNGSPAINASRGRRVGATMPPVDPASDPAVEHRIDDLPLQAHTERDGHSRRAAVVGMDHRDDLRAARDGRTRPSLPRQLPRSSPPHGRVQAPPQMRGRSGRGQERRRMRQPRRRR